MIMYAAPCVPIGWLRNYSRLVFYCRLLCSAIPFCSVLVSQCDSCLLKGVYTLSGYRARRLNIPCLKLGNIWEYSSIFKTARIVKNIWRIINIISSIWGENMLGYLSLNNIYSSKLTVFFQLRSQKTVCFSEQILSTDKYPSIILCQMEAIVYVLEIL